MMIFFMAPRGSSPEQLIVRYYICEGDRLRWRLPATLHRKILAGEVVVSEFAGTKQRVLEVFLNAVDKRKVPVLRGSIYCFNDEGTLDQNAAVELFPSVWEKERKPGGASKVVDAASIFRYRKWINENTWHPKAMFYHLVQHDLQMRGAKERVPSLAKLTRSLKT
jgi:hypothetical protein